MRTLALALLLAALLAQLGLSAHAQKADPLTEIPRLEAGAHFTFIHANAPPGGCACFNLKGAGATAAWHLTRRFAVAGQYTRSHANHIGPLGQDLTLATFTVGPRITVHHRRWHAYGQFLFGAARGSDSYFPTSTSYTTTASSKAWTTGGGADYDLSNHFAVRALEAQFLRSYLPNGSTDVQNHLMLSAGLLFKLHGR